ncbi:MAG: hypothetical protein IJO43_04165 [Bacilli bacterium]|nr:hypothetical protein [Bacilli bacterium]
MKKYIVLLISIILDGLISNISLYQINHLTYFTSLCTVISLVVVYNNEDFIKLLILSSVVYGGLYMSNILLSFVLFFAALMTIKYLKKELRDNLFTILLQFIIIIFVYDFILFFIMSFINVGHIGFNHYFYKITHSLLLNLLYGISIYFIYDKKVLN